MQHKQAAKQYRKLTIKLQIYGNCSVATRFYVGVLWLTPLTPPLLETLIFPILIALIFQDKHRVNHPNLLNYKLRRGVRDYPAAGGGNEATSLMDAVNSSN